MKKYIITGGCGFIGTSLITRLQGNDVQIRVYDSLITGTREDLAEVASFTEISPENNPSSPGVYLYNGDIRDAAALQAASQGTDCLIHLAANTGVGPSVENPRLDMECNVMGTFNALEAARLNEIKQFIFASSDAPAGEVTPPIHEELPPHPVSPYGASKLAGEGYCSAYYRTFGINTVALRFGNVYGPRSKHKSSVVAKFIRTALEGKICTIFGDGMQTRDFIYIDDLISAMQLALDKNIGGETFQIASGSERTIKELAILLQRMLNSHGITMQLAYTEKRKGDVLRNFSDTTKAKNMLGWVPEYSLEKGLENTIKYFLTRG